MKSQKLLNRNKIYWLILLLIIPLLSFHSDTVSNTENCTQSYRLSDSYIIKKRELTIIKALKHHGFEVKRGLEDVYGDVNNVHFWRVMNINTPNGLIKEFRFKIETNVKGLESKTKLTSVNLCVNEQTLTQKSNTLVNQHRKYIKKQLINKIKAFDN